MLSVIQQLASICFTYNLWWLELSNGRCSGPLSSSFFPALLPQGTGLARSIDSATDSVNLGPLASNPSWIPSFQWKDMEQKPLGVRGIDPFVGDIAAIRRSNPSSRSKKSISKTVPTCMGVFGLCLNTKIGFMLFLRLRHPAQIPDCMNP